VTDRWTDRQTNGHGTTAKTTLKRNISRLKPHQTVWVRSSKLPVLSLLTGQKSVFRSTVVTRCTNSGQTWQGRRAPGSAWLCKISPQSAHGVGMWPKISKISTFW